MNDRSVKCPHCSEESPYHVGYRVKREAMCFKCHKLFNILLIVKDGKFVDEITKVISTK